MAKFTIMHNNKYICNGQDLYLSGLHFYLILNLFYLFHINRLKLEQVTLLTKYPKTVTSEFLPASLLSRNRSNIARF